MDRWGLRIFPKEDNSLTGKDGFFKFLKSAIAKNPRGFKKDKYPQVSEYLSQAAETNSCLNGQVMNLKDSLQTNIQNKDTRFGDLMYY